MSRFTKIIPATLVAVAFTLPASAQMPVSGQDGTTQGHGCEVYAETGFGGNVLKFNGGEAVSFTNATEVAGRPAFANPGFGDSVGSVASTDVCEVTIVSSQATVTQTNNNDMTGSVSQSGATGAYCTCN